MNYIVSIILLFSEDKDAFFIMLSLIDEILPRNSYSSSMSGLYTDQYVLMHLIWELFPHMGRQIEMNFFRLLMSSLPWFSCLFVNCLQGEVLLRVWGNLDLN